MCLNMLGSEDLILVEVHIKVIIFRVYYTMMVHWLPHKGFPLEIFGKLSSIISVLDFVLCLMI